MATHAHKNEFFSLSGHIQQKGATWASGAAWNCRKTPESQNGVREISVRSSRQQSVFTAHQEYATLVLHSNVRLVSKNMVAIISDRDREDFRSRSAGHIVFDLAFYKANRDKPFGSIQERIATMRHVQWLS